MRLLTFNVIYLSLILSALSYTGYILFLIAMHGLSRVYNDDRIFKNSLYGFIDSIIGAVVFVIVAFAVLVLILDQFTAYASSPGVTPPLSIVISFLQVMVAVLIGGPFLRRLMASFTGELFMRWRKNQARTTFTWRAY